MDPNYPPPPPEYAPAGSLPGRAPETQPLGAERRDGAAKGSAFGVAILLHGLILSLLGLIVLQTMEEAPPELVVEAGDVEIPATIVPREFANATRPNPSAPSMATAMVVTASAPSIVSVPEVEDTDAFEIGMGDAFGAGLGIGMGGSGGGGVGFFGSRSTASRVAYIVDVSMSLSEKQFTMIKEELSKSLNRLAANIEYQVIFFAGPAWFAGDEFVGKSKRRFTIKQGRQEYIWDTTGGAHQYQLENRKDLPSAKWKSASKANLHKTNKHIEEARKIYGTDWEWPLKVALQQLEPKPDVVYFLTDGVTGGVDETLDDIKRINRTKGTKAKINTISMMEPRAASALRRLAKESGGSFTIVNADGSTTVDDLKGASREEEKGRRKKTPKKDEK
ncbi:MAG: hypothetical protein ACR2RV_16590 [Verrucomicrobiales bacterium]